MTQLKLLKILVIAGLLFSGQARAGESFSQIYIFGDSLSDTGNYSSVRGPLPLPFYMNRISNGPVAVEVLAQNLGFNADASLHLVGPAVGSNYAVAGARALTELFLDLDAQIASFLANNNGVAPSDALYVVMIGGNDIRSARSNIDLSEAKASVKAAASEVGVALQTLASAGAQTVLLVNSPDIGALPETQSAAEAIGDNGLIAKSRKLSKVYRRALHRVVKSFDEDDDENASLEIVEFDLLGYFNQLIRKSSKKEFVNNSDACFNLSAFSFHPDCNGSLNFDAFIFFDEIHPTARVHAMAGQALYEAVADADDDD